MLPAYKMVVLNLILSAILLLGLIVYKYFFKRKVNLFYLLILISILPIVSIFRVGTYESGDLSLHTQRLISFYNLLFNYHLIPRWTPEFNAGFGDPHFLFAYFLPYFVSSIFHHIGFSFLTSVKLLLSFSFVVSGITMYFWVKEELGKNAGFVAAIFYLFMPYHLVDIHFRVSIAENLSFVFLPLCLLAAKKTIEEGGRKWFVTLSVSVELLILSHQAISIMFAPIILAYSIFTWTRNNKLKNIIYCFISILFGFLISSFYWLPIIFLAKFTQQGLNPTAISFPNLTELIYSPWRFGFLFQGHKGELSYLIGYTQLFIVSISIYLIIKNKVDKKLKNLLLFFLVTFAILIFMILPISKPIWEATPLLKYSQLSTRLLVLLALCISVIAGIVVKKINKNSFIFLLCLFTIFSTILNWGNRRTIPNIQDDYLKQEFNIKPDIGGMEPSSPIWANLEKSKLRVKPKSNIEITGGKAQVLEILRTPIHHEYLINAESEIEVKENTLFFPGWKATINNKPHVINYTNPQSPGVITFKFNKGFYKINVEYVDLPIIIFSEYLSIVSLAAILIYTFFPLKIRNSKN